MVSGKVSGMEQRINVVTLVVADLGAARRFYVDALGWVPSLEAPGDVLMIQVGEKLILSLWAEEQAAHEIGPVTRAGRLPLTLAYNTSSPEDVDAVLAAAAAGGATVSSGQRREWGGYSGYFDDPCGFTWEVAHNPHPIGRVSLP